MRHYIVGFNLYFLFTLKIFIKYFFQQNLCVCGFFLLTGFKNQLLNQILHQTKIFSQFLASNGRSSVIAALQQTSVESVTVAASFSPVQALRFERSSSWIIPTTFPFSLGIITSSRTRVRDTKPLAVSMTLINAMAALGEMQKQTSDKKAFHFTSPVFASSDRVLVVTFLDQIFFRHA